MSATKPQQLIVSNADFEVNFHSHNFHNVMLNLLALHELVAHQSSIIINADTVQNLQTTLMEAAGTSFCYKSA